MVEKEEIDTKEEIITLKEKVKILEKEAKEKDKTYSELSHRHYQTRERLNKHLFTTRWLLGTLVIVSFLLLIFYAGSVSFLKETETNNGIGFDINDELANVPNWGLVIIGWIAILIFLIILWIMFFVFETDWCYGGKY